MNALAEQNHSFHLALIDIGFTIPGQSWTYWHLGPGPGPGEHTLHTGDLFRSDADGWEVALHGVDERLSVSRRQLASLRELLQQSAR